MKFTHLEGSRDKIVNIIFPPSNCYPTELRLYKSFPIVYWDWIVFLTSKVYLYKVNYECNNRKTQKSEKWVIFVNYYVPMGCMI